MTHFLTLIALLAGLLAPIHVHAHALEPGYLEISQETDTDWHVFWRKPDVRGAPMDIDVALPENCSAPAFDAPVFDGRAWTQVWRMTCADDLRGNVIRIDRLEAQRTDVLLRVGYLDTVNMATFRLTPDAPSVVLPAQQGLLQTLWQYGVLGFEHILEGWDHLLFVFALLVLIRNLRQLIWAVTAFTVAHSITLGLATFGVLNVPGPPVEAVIALSIVFLATEVLRSDDKPKTLASRIPWVISFGFGLLHGLGFAGALAEIGLPEQDIPAALLAFNLGVEAGQLAFIFAVLGVFVTLRKIVQMVWGWSLAQGTSRQILGYPIGCIAAFWLAERLAGF
ncbi:MULTISPECIES: HupE/UreJ family protein [unclassified Ruegeria]|uniref:HupE/UreJ family protein n=1 Tax=unclassified Ruegeria TaxID=2625375 RepID=UPI001ADC1D12|nr:MULTISPECIES: HupE/UreJ family protein [unclassified Ruegeria]MBO9410973.1 HupE/UreJ family protein [Ruegeria sp. R8_1]MBO9415174.1 HupE/UreJ family protein [Ruegeria sp. R8_2]